MSYLAGNIDIAAKDHHIAGYLDALLDYDVASEGDDIPLHTRAALNPRAAPEQHDAVDRIGRVYNCAAAHANVVAVARTLCECRGCHEGNQYQRD